MHFSRKLEVEGAGGPASHFLENLLSNPLGKADNKRTRKMFPVIEKSQENMGFLRGTKKYPEGKLSRCRLRAVDFRPRSSEW